MPPIVTLLTDFGLRDSYVGEVKGVLLSLVPRVELVDLTHDVAPGDVRAAQYVLGRAWPRFPAGTVHLAVVDPGVGTARRALAAEVAGHYFVAPDNGLLSSLPGEARFVALATPAGASATFHGRDLFAPAAAALANGAALSHLGPIVTDIFRLPLPKPRAGPDGVVGEVVYIDRFGTLVSNLPVDQLGPNSTVNVGGRNAGTLRRTFADVRPGELVVFIGSGGAVEIAVRDGNAAQQLGLGIGAPVVLTP